jgi:3-mercaptopyruvate sulfurtransferase SseA
MWQDTMPMEQELAQRTKRFLKAELKRADVTYEELARRMTEMGVEETKASVASKLSRGAFSATFFVASLKAIGAEQIRLQDL